MNLWNRIVLGAKFMRGGFESATDYLLTLLNAFLSKDGIASRIQQSRAFVKSILSYMNKYEKYCPAIWAADYLKLQEVVQMLVDVFEDGQVETAEIQKAIKTVKAAIEEWMK